MMSQLWRQVTNTMSPWKRRREKERQKTEVMLKMQGSDQATIDRSMWRRGLRLARAEAAQAAAMEATRVAKAAEKKAYDASEKAQKMVAGTGCSKGAEENGHSNPEWWVCCRPKGTGEIRWTRALLPGRDHRG